MGKGIGRNGVTRPPTTSCRDMPTALEEPRGCDYLPAPAACPHPVATCPRPTRSTDAYAPSGREYRAAGGHAADAGRSVELVEYGHADGAGRPVEDIGQRGAFGMSLQDGFVDRHLVGGYGMHAEHLYHSSSVETDGEVDLADQLA